MGVILTHSFTDNACALKVGFVRPEAQVIVHGVKQAPLGRLQPVTGVRQGAGNDDGHGVIQERLGHLIRYIDRGDVIVGRVAHYVAMGVKLLIEERAGMIIKRRDCER